MQEVSEEFKVLRCERCGKTFEIPVEDTKGRNYSKRCDACRVSVTRAMNEPGRNRKERVVVWQRYELTKYTTKEIIPAEKVESKDKLEIFPGVIASIPSGLPEFVRDAIREGARITFLRIASSEWSKDVDNHDLPGETEIQRYIAQMISDRPLGAVERFLNPKRDALCHLKAIWWVREDSRKAAEVGYATQHGLRELVSSPEFSAGLVDDADAIKCYIEVRLNGRPMREIAKMLGISKSTVERKIKEVEIGIQLATAYTSLGEPVRDAYRDVVAKDNTERQRQPEKVNSEPRNTRTPEPQATPYERSECVGPRAYK